MPQKSLVNINPAGDYHLSLQIIFQLVQSSDQLNNPFPAHNFRRELLGRKNKEKVLDNIFRHVGILKSPDRMINNKCTKLGRKCVGNSWFLKEARKKC